MQRRRYVGGLATLTDCIDGDCRALQVLDAIQGLIEEARGTTMSMAELSRAVQNMQSRGRGLQIMDPIIEPKKKKRKTSKYQREFGKQLKALKKKHPRTPVTRLMKRAHRATKRRMK